ncbi:peptidoglycan-binding protein [Streptomyces flavotricini]|uniref:Peptidoglycan-binding protein n=1 Tax=Streptomyces flavotricini TaxID=66888 RepID=A0ABS8E2N6_9ACTN|nr:peptidoglycan-binding domain-containing protein [Streptomyces flavotricini]MCC0095396.1 peptidoglycan-binding protein [Streptomyces flavotricini]
MLKKTVSRAAALAAAAALTVLSLSGTAQARQGAPYIGYGKTNNTHAVWCVQHQLNYAFAHNWTGRPGSHGQISEDGRFGPQTEEAIRFFQSVMFVPKDVDGIVGPDTGYALLWYGDPYYGYDDKVTHAGYCNEYLPSVV